MFSGIVEELGQVSAIGDGHITITAGAVIGGARAGDSIAVSGCCLTITDLNAPSFTADVMPETLRRTTLGGLHPGDPVNLEAAMRHDARVGGHLVTGHVDGVGAVDSVREDGNALVVAITAPSDLLPLLVEKGSVAVDGISLTVIEVSATGFTVGLIPHTRAATTAGAWVAGTRVNLEGDLVAKHVQRAVAIHLAGARPVVLTTER